MVRGHQSTCTSWSKWMDFQYLSFCYISWDLPRGEKIMEMTHLKQMLGSVYGYPPPRNLIFGNIFVQSYTQPESEAACCCPVSSKLVLHRECKAREVLRKCTSWIKPAKNIHGASEDRGILCLVTDNSWTKRNWLALITACLPSGCCRASCSKAPSRIWQVAANES